MIIFSLINMKGGVGKTTISTNLAVDFANRGVKVLFIDNDEQNNSSLFFNVSNEKKTLSSLYMEPSMDINEIIYSTKYKNIDCIPAGLNLNNILTLYLEDERFKNVDKSIILKNKLSTISDKYDICIMDNHPGITVATYNGLMAANLVIIVTDTNIYAKQGLDTMIEYLNAIKIDRKNYCKDYDDGILTKSINLCGCLVNKYIYNPNFSKKKKYNYFKTNIRMVPRNKLYLFDSAIISNKSFIELAPRSNFSRDIKKLVDEIIKKII